MYICRIETLEWNRSLTNCTHQVSGFCFPPRRISIEANDKKCWPPKNRQLLLLVSATIAKRRKWHCLGSGYCTLEDASTSVLGYLSFSKKRLYGQPLSFHYTKWQILFGFNSNEAHHRNCLSNPGHHPKSMIIYFEL